MIVNFYEKLSDERNRHRSPDFHRSQINYTVYASRGYLVFAPDIPYRTGYPGESAYDAIVSGVTSLFDKGLSTLNGWPCKATPGVDTGQLTSLPAPTFSPVRKPERRWPI